MNKNDVLMKHPTGSDLLAIAVFSFFAGVWLTLAVVLAVIDITTGWWAVALVGGLLMGALTLLSVLVFTDDLRLLTDEAEIDPSGPGQEDRAAQARGDR